MDEFTRTYARHFTTEEINANPHKVQKMIFVDIEDWRARNFQKRTPACRRVRKLINKRERELKAIKKETKKRNKEKNKEKNKQQSLDRKVEKLLHQIDHMHKYTIMHASSLIYTDPDSDEYQLLRSTTARNIGNMIHDLIKVYTGLISLEAWKKKQHNKKYIPTFDHFHPRSIAGGEDIIKLAEGMIYKCGKFEKRDILNVIYSCSQGNKVTAKENRIILPPYQKLNTFVNPTTTYNEADIILVLEQEFIIPPVWEVVANMFNINLLDIPKFDNVIMVNEAKKTLIQTPKLRIVTSN